MRSENFMEIHVHRFPLGGGGARGGAFAPLKKKDLPPKISIMCSLPPPPCQVFPGPYHTSYIIRRERGQPDKQDL